MSRRCKHSDLRIVVSLVMGLLLTGCTVHAMPPWHQTLPTESRFVFVLNTEAVLDNETGLVWERSPGDTDGDGDVDDADKLNWLFARRHCADKTVGSRKGWRLPSLHELASLADPSQAEPALPPDHPFRFTVLTEGNYYSATSDSFNPDAAWGVNFRTATVQPLIKQAVGFPGFFVWCVRGGGPLSKY